MMLMDQLELVEIAYKLTTRQFDGKKARDTQGDVLTGNGLNNYLVLQWSQYLQNKIISKLFLFKIKTFNLFSNIIPRGPMV